MTGHNTCSEITKTCSNNVWRMERTNAGLEVARKRGRKGGRPTVDAEKVELAMKMRESGEFSVKEILKATGLSQGTYYKYANGAENGR